MPRLHETAVFLRELAVWIMCARPISRSLEGDAAFANPDIYRFLEVEGMGYAIRLPANRVLQEKTGYLLKRPVGRPPDEVRRYYVSFRYQAGSWDHGASPAGGGQG